MRKYLIIIAFLVVTPATAHSFDAISAVGNLLGFIKETALGPASPSPSAPEVPSTPVAPVATPPAQPTAPVCGLVTMAPAKVCDEGAGFLCVNTPSLSVVEDTVKIMGTIDVKANQLSSLSVSIQHEYTNEYKQIKFDKPDSSENCWENATGNYCLDKNGYFSVTVPLTNKLGPYSILVSATRSNGAPAEEKIRVSRVIAPNLKPEDVKVEVAGTNAQVSIDLLHSCQFCDHLGISTGGLEVTLKNIIIGKDGGTKQITERTNLAASGGFFSICLPLGNGTNNISVSVCNSATGFQKCPSLDLKPIESEGSAAEITWLKAPETFYSADIDPNVEIQFQLNTNSAILNFNRDPERTITAGPDGKFTLVLEPKTGTNIGIIRVGDKTYPFSFSWGEIVSPFATEDLWIKSAGAFVINKDFLTDTTRGLINNFARSDEFKKLLKDLPQMLDKGGNTTDERSKNEMIAIRNEIPMCGSASSSGDKYAFKIAREPVLGNVSIPKIEFKQDTISLVLEADNIDIRANVFLDNDSDGNPDKKVLPLKIGFSKIFSPIDIKVDRSGSKPKYLLTGPSTDCEYKPGHACTHKPAILVPKDFFGSATRFGAIVACDRDVDPDCAGIDITNSQTGMVNMLVLDALNDKLYCDGSAALTYFIREKIKEVNVPVKIADRNWTVPVGLDLLGNKFNVNERTISGTVPAIVGSKNFFASFPDDLKKPDVGYIRRPFLASQPAIANTTNYDLGISVSEDVINALLFVLTEQDPGNAKGLLDWDLHEVLLKKLEFDSVKECDEFKSTSPEDKHPALCDLRLRVSDILGSTLTTNGYFQPKQPIMLRARGNRKMPPRIALFYQDGKQYIDVQVADLEISFFALQIDADRSTDQHGNLPLKLDENGDPIIWSMNPSDPAPDNGPIIKVKLSAMLAFEITKLTTDEDDPSKLMISIRPEQNLSQIVFKSVEGGNSTIIPDDKIVSAFEEKIKFGINIYSDPSKAIKMKLPKAINFDQLNVLGIKKISFGANGLQLQAEDSQEYLDIFLKMSFDQVLSIDGQPQTFTIPK